jgi:cell division protein FtsN
MSTRASSANILAVCIILAATIVILTGSGTFRIAQGQANDTSLTSANDTSLTPEQKDAICNPNNPSSRLNPVNTTESRICGIPVTVKPSNMTSATNTTSGTEAPPSATNTTSGTEAPPSATSIAPSAVPST